MVKIIDITEKQLVNKLNDLGWEVVNHGPHGYSAHGVRSNAVFDLEAKAYKEALIEALKYVS